MKPTFDIPPIGPVSGKVWGVTQLGFAYNGTEAHAIGVQKGGYCSTHSHTSKWNRFMVLSGTLAIRQYRNESEFDETIIRAGQVVDVPPGVRHDFRALDQTMAIEFYWTVLDVGDIDRHGTEGGLLE